ncbi:flavodoxin-dependent (E)-4-hydroxy-3-methylbut-2-enyl-diphosphate synthase [Blochmannia endosymbiont of Camponotus modoc]|uniref:flavodoxin-dependent (E)-4-hydroxy-3-methylbut-2-enyl-diphosphate synthase n=1 Tax=Blochmannia endosymbiont of Camponotus modoc TaxID=2945587 RepID=UPI002025A898|nr:flavodoxin-dependent (E)-4-hydroxy-3-methylbut-2-enyl-diphosphate synthase [Blochmannia endosymbiont of Camponotus modoc]URJ26273.1 flavodoxin-dependent (E)-4-hydroxy-3-methylbut-2-enyl-diphosphate synthase [Blochmannia endosymbiont of Camponotus modoc]
MNNITNIVRRKSTRIYIGNVPIGDGAPIAVQSMVNTRTTNIVETVTQINALKKAGVDIVRISIPTMDAAEAFKIIKRKVINIPLVADIHFDYRIALKVAEYGADCLRINPGNIGNNKRIRSVVHCAQDKNISIRIGVNSGSLERDLQKKYDGNPTEHVLLESAMRHVDILDKLNFHQFKVSVKSSDVLITIQAYRALASKIDQPLHIGLTEAGALRNGTVKSAMAVGFLLNEGIGDTIRISLATDPIEEVKVAFDILRALKIRAHGINFIACPGCARQEFNVINVVNALEEKVSDITTPMDVSIIGCVVNGPGEALKSTIGVAGARNKSGIYEDGIRQQKRCDNISIVEELERRIRAKSKLLNQNNPRHCPITYHK